MRSNNFDMNFLKTLCTPEWCAKTYGEYLLDCGARQADLIGLITQLATDDEIEEAIEAKSAPIDAAITNFKNATRGLLKFKPEAYADSVIQYRTVVPDYKLAPISYSMPANAYADAKSMVLPSASDAGLGLVYALYNLTQVNEIFDEIIPTSTYHLSGEAGVEALRSQEMQDFDIACMELQNVLHQYGALPIVTNDAGNDAIDLISMWNMSADKVLVNTPWFNNLISPAVESGLVDIGISKNAAYPMPDGSYAKIGDYITVLVKQMLNQTAEMEATVQTYTYNGTLSAVSPVNFDENMEWLKSSMASAIAWGQGFISAGIPSISDALASFSANVETAISDVTANFASAVSSVKETLANAVGSVRNFFDLAGTKLGFTQVDEDQFSSPVDTDEFGFSGASPMATVALAVGIGAGGAAAGVVYAGIALFKGASWLFGKLKQGVAKVLAPVKAVARSIGGNPEDFYVANGHSDNYWCDVYNPTSRHTVLDFNIDHNYFGPDSITAWSEVMSHLPEDFITFETLFGVIRVRINKSTPFWYSLEVDEVTRDYHLYLRDVDIVIKLLATDAKTLQDYGLVGPDVEGAMLWRSQVRSTADLPLMEQWVNNGVIRPQIENDERVLYSSFIWSLLMLQTSLNFSIRELNSQMIHNNFGDAALTGANVYDSVFDESRVSYSNSASDYRAEVNVSSWVYTTEDTGHILVPYTLDNVDAIKLVSAAYQTSSSSPWIFDHWPVGTVQSPLSYGQPIHIGQVVAPMIALYLEQRFVRYFFPMDYFYLPYSMQFYSLDGGRYGVNTDKRNAIILGAAIAAAVVAIAATALAITVKKIRRNRRSKKLYKYSRITGQLDNDMWNGKKLDNKQMRKYLKYKRKLEKFDIVGGGLPGGTSVIQKVSGLKENVETIIAKPAFLNDPAGNDSQYEADYSAITESVGASTKAISSLIGTP